MKTTENSDRAEGCQDEATKRLRNRAPSNTVRVRLMAACTNLSLIIDELVSEAKAAGNTNAVKRLRAANFRVAASEHLLLGKEPEADLLLELSRETTIGATALVGSDGSLVQNKVTS